MEDAIYDIQIQRRIVVAKNAFQNLSRILRSMKMSFETKKSILNCDVIYIPLYDTECHIVKNAEENIDQLCAQVLVKIEKEQ